jgi:hypothetical protein
MPPLFAGAFWGASPPKLQLSAPYAFCPTHSHHFDMIGTQLVSTIIMDDFDSFKLEPFTIEELNARDRLHDELSDPSFKDFFLRLQEKTLASDQDLKQSHEPRFHGSSHALAKAQPQLQPWIESDISKGVKEGIANFLITTPRIQVSFQIRHRGCFHISHSMLSCDNFTHIYMFISRRTYVMDYGLLNGGHIRGEIRRLRERKLCESFMPHQLQTRHVLILFFIFAQLVECLINLRKLRLSTP